MLIRSLLMPLHRFMSMWKFTANGWHYTKILINRIMLSSRQNLPLRSTSTAMMYPNRCENMSFLIMHIWVWFMIFRWYNVCQLRIRFSNSSNNNKCHHLRAGRRTPHVIISFPKWINILWPFEMIVPLLLLSVMYPNCWC